MNRPIITAKVGNLKKDGWIDIYADGWLICTIWGKAKVTYKDDELLAKYWLNINNTDAFLYVNAIQRREVAIAPIREAVGVGS